ncbi:MAG: orotate phosphoribosyltransferase [Candidatus Bathyarchaeota archaeon]|nr:orotate phosphoribosyltransferase [Candidatus Bathyarchaeota archaeon]MCX8176953.1 orotate phosphoribosyltransferase [Candidatus Bathyarchaeota archaeon]MDW8193360.1 orotate phosphoribosyltransferase [Nitrososphaerota archaeon]
MPMEKHLEPVKLEICKILNKIGALQFGTFKLTSGKISPYYIDLRLVPSFPDAFQKICTFYTDFINKEVGVENFERVAGIPVAGMPFASIIAYNLKKPFIYIRKGVRLHGRQRRIEGLLNPGDRVLLVDDLITTGLSLRRAAKAINAEGGVVKDVVVLLDRQESGAEKLGKIGIRLRALVKISEAAQILYEIGSINEEQLKTILKQIKEGK